VGWVELRPAVTDADLRACAAVRNGVERDRRVGVAELRRALENGDQTLFVMASVDGSVAGCGQASRSSVRGAAFVRAWVLPGFRRRGVGSALHLALCDHATRIGATFLRTRVTEGEGEQSAALGFLMRRGFVEVGRDCESRLPLGGAPVVPVPVPDGVEIASFASRLDLAREVHALAIEGMADIPTSEDVVVGTFDEWSRENVEEALLDGSFLAVAGGTVVGSAGLAQWPSEPAVAEHLLTAVSRSWRRRGVARALKTAQITWAGSAGYRELVTYNDARNEPMRRLNAQLGYQPRPVQITLHGPLAVSGGGR
jgi:GNAT superfamily N-acetyltransferase